MRLKAILAGAMLAVLSIVAVACGGNDDADNGGEQEIEITWLYTGPQEDGGWNDAMEGINESTQNELDGVTTRSVFELPYTERLTQVANQAIAQGTTGIVDTLGAGPLIQRVCAQNPEVYCLLVGDPEEQTDNSRSWWARDWDLGYLGGVAAGLMTETNEIGIVNSFDLPVARQAVNSYALGCQSVNPECTVRVIYINAFYDPPEERRAAESLISAGADVLRNWVDTPATCQAAEEAGVYAVPNFLDQISACPQSTIFSTVWDVSDYMREQAEAMRDGTFEGGGPPDLLPITDGEGGPHLGEYGEFVPDDVRERIDEIRDQMIDGEDFIVGPIRDRGGELRFEDGEVVPLEFMYTSWNWYVEGVIAQD
jgi:basic membrane protein A and related proteins